MKKILIKTCLFASVAAFGAVALAQGHQLHSWEKLTEQQGVNGQMVCQWVCRQVNFGGPVGSNEHYTTTSGNGRCPMP
jgi:hypothetical protein